MTGSNLRLTGQAEADELRMLLNGYLDEFAAGRADGPKYITTKQTAARLDACATPAEREVLIQRFLATGEMSLDTFYDNDGWIRERLLALDAWQQEQDGK